MSDRRLAAQDKAEQHTALEAVAAKWMEAIRVERLTLPERVVLPESIEAMDASNARLRAYEAESEARGCGCSQEEIDYHAGRSFGLS